MLFPPGPLAATSDIDCHASHNLFKGNQISASVGTEHKEEIEISRFILDPAISCAPVASGHVERRRVNTRVALITGILTLHSQKYALTLNNQVIFGNVSQRDAHYVSRRHKVMNRTGDSQVAFQFVVHVGLLPTT